MSGTRDGTPRPIRLGIVGAGGIARAEHLPRFRRIPGVALAGVANRSLDSAERAAAAEGIDRAFASWQELVVDDGIDAVLVATWPDQHATVTVAALEAGKHVLCEARMAATLADARSMVTAAHAQPDLVAMIVPASFSLWADRTIRRLLDDGAIGTPRHLRVVWDAAGSVAPSEHWRWQRSASGVNTMALGILAEAMERWLGPATGVRAAGRIVLPAKPGPDGPVAGDVVDHLLVTADLPGEVTAAIEMSVLAGRTTIELVGDGGVLEVDLAEQALTVVGAGGGRSPVAIRDEDRLGWTAEEDFVRSIREAAAVELTDVDTAFRYMAFVDAVDRALRSGAREVPAPA